MTTGDFVYITIFYVLPLIIGFLATKGNWRIALKSYVYWAAVILIISISMSWEPGAVVTIFLISWMFSALFMIPILAICLLIWERLIGARGGDENATDSHV